MVSRVFQRALIFRRALHNPVFMTQPVFKFETSLRHNIRSLRRLMSVERKSFATRHQLGCPLRPSFVLCAMSRACGKRGLSIIDDRLPPSCCGRDAACSVLCHICNVNACGFDTPVPACRRERHVCVGNYLSKSHKIYMLKFGPSAAFVLLPTPMSGRNCS